MKQSLIQTYQGQIRTGTWELSKRLGVQHRYIKTCIEKKTEAFLALAPLPYVKMRRVALGRPVREYLLNRDQCVWVIFLCSICGDKKALYVDIQSKACITDAEYFKFLDENL